MASTTDESDLSPKELADLSALADGTLDPARRTEVQAHVSASAELSALYARERRVVEMLHETQRTVRAPDALRARLRADRPGARSVARRRFGYMGGLAGALAILVLAVLLALPGGTPGSPSIGQAAALAALGPAAPAPALDPRAPSVALGRNIEDVYFPNWSGQFGWRASGQRNDRIGGRLAVTVYYQWHGMRIAYTIVGAPALTQPKARVSRLGGTELRTLVLRGRLVVTWRRAGHTCVLSGQGVPASELLRLAAWKAPGIARA